MVLLVAAFPFATLIASCARVFQLIAWLQWRQVQDMGWQELMHQMLAQTQTNLDALAAPLAASSASSASHSLASDSAAEDSNAGEANLQNWSISRSSFTFRSQFLPDRWFVSR